jgi:hypothetical protein
MLCMKRNISVSLALARKYRPATFDDLIGQEAVSQTLSLALTLSVKRQFLKPYHLHSMVTDSLMLTFFLGLEVVVKPLQHVSLQKLYSVKEVQFPILVEHVHIVLWQPKVVTWISSRWMLLPTVV